jgi:iron complex transport system substrate-binding protein
VLRPFVRPLRPALGGLVALALLAITGCQPASYSAGTDPAPAAQNTIPLGDIAWLDEPKSWQGPSTAVLSTSSFEPLSASDVTSELPQTVTSDDLSGPVEVVIESTERIIAVDMSGSLAQTVWGLGLGDRLVGRDISTTLPGTEDLPVVTGTGHSISVESVLELRPDLVLTDGTVGPIDVMLQLREAGITLVFVREPAGLSQPAAQAHRVAAILGMPERGEELASRIERDVAAVVDTIEANISSEPDQRLRMVFLYLRGANGIYYLFGEESGAGDLITALGGIDVAGEIGWAGLRPMTDEALIRANPDLILVMSHGLESVGGVDALLDKKPAIGLTTAGRNRRFVDMADAVVLGFGPRTPAVLDALARAIYAPTP